MNIETREVRLGWSEKGERERNLKVYESFGWKYTQDVRRGKSSYDLLARDMDMPNYRLIKALDDKYFALKEQKKYYQPIYDDPLNFLMMFALLILFVFPLVIYLVFKSRQKARIQAHNANLERQMEECLKEARALL